MKVLGPEYAADYWASVLHVCSNPPTNREYSDTVNGGLTLTAALLLCPLTDITLFNQLVRFSGIYPVSGYFTLLRLA